MSRRVWEILLLLPTNPEIKQRLQDVDQDSDMASLLDPHCPQKLLYTFYIIDWLGRQARWAREVLCPAGDYFNIFLISDYVAIPVSVIETHPTLPDQGRPAGSTSSYR